MEKIDIFINTISDIDEYPTNECYKLLELGEGSVNNEYPIEVVKDSIGDNISEMNRYVCEFTGMYWVWKNYELKDYVGFCQYRRFFKFWNDIPDLDAMFKKHDVLIGSPLLSRYDMKTHYKFFHNINDLNSLRDSVEKTNPEYIESFDKFLTQNRIYACNLFIMKKDDFKKYCEFVYSTIIHFMEKEKINNYEDCLERVVDNKAKYLKGFKPNNTVDYQARFMAYLVERLTNVFVLKHFKKPYPLEIVETQGKYGYNVFNKKD